MQLTQNTKISQNYYRKAWQDMYADAEQIISTVATKKPLQPLLTKLLHCFSAQYKYLCVNVTT